MPVPKGGEISEPSRRNPGSYGRPVLLEALEQFHEL